jgi:hypothetical protein
LFRSLLESRQISYSLEFDYEIRIPYFDKDVEHQDCCAPPEVQGLGVQGLNTLLQCDGELLFRFPAPEAGIDIEISDGSLFSSNFMVKSKSNDRGDVAAESRLESATFLLRLNSLRKNSKTRHSEARCAPRNPSSSVHSHRERFLTSFGMTTKTSLHYLLFTKFV